MRLSNFLGKMETSRQSSPKSICDSFETFIGQTVSKNNCPPVPEKMKIFSISRKVIRLFSEEGTVVHLNGAFTLVGDLHGSLQDLMNIFSLFGLPPKTSYLFLGDYVDRGDFSVEVITYLLALKARYPTNIYLIRGNHEFQHINKVYGFYDEIIEKYKTEDVWVSFNQVFSYLPLAVILNEKIFCVHGGLSPLTPTVHEIANIKLPIVSYVGLTQVSDLVWSDPTDLYPEFIPSDRGAGVIFGRTAVQNFLVNSGLSLLVRAHQCISTGVHAFAGTLGITVFSHSKYANEDNKCGVASVTPKNNLTFFSIDGKEILEKATMSLLDGKIGLQPYKPPKIRKQKKKVVKKASTAQTHPPAPELEM